MAGELVCRCAKQHSERASTQPSQRGAKHGAQADELHLTRLELIDRIAGQVPPPRAHRHRYDGVLAPNSPHRAAAVALAADQTAGSGTGTAQPEPGGVPPDGHPKLPHLWPVKLLQAGQVGL